MIVCTSANTTNRMKPGGRDITHKVLEATAPSLAALERGWRGYDVPTGVMVTLVFFVSYFFARRLLEEVRWYDVTRENNTHFTDTVR